MSESEPVWELVNTLRDSYARVKAERDELMALVREASEIMTIVYAGNFPAGIESFLVRAHDVSRGRTAQAETMTDSGSP